MAKEVAAFIKLQIKGGADQWQKLINSQNIWLI